MTSDEQIAAIQTNLARKRKMLDLGAALERLERNKDFKLVIGQAYLNDEAVRLVHLRADPALDAVAQTGALRDMDGISALLQFLHAIPRNAALARKEIIDGEDTIQQLTEEKQNG